MGGIHGVSLTAPPLAQFPTEWIGMVDPEPWMRDALCAETDPEAFYPEKGGSTRDAKRVCAECDVTGESVPVEIEAGPDELFAVSIGGVSGRARVRKESMAARVARAVALVEAEPAESWLLWCGLNDEADALTALIPGAVNVHGSMTPEGKAVALLAFARGETRVLVTKPSIAGMGLNFQVAARMAFVGLSDSYEAYYQCIRRCYRYGQSRVVRAHIVLSEIEAQIADNVARKERQANRIVDGMIRHLREAS